MFFRLGTLGCKVNQYESEFLREGLIRLGYLEAEPDRPADLVLVNTCTVTAESDLKSRKTIRKLIKENPGAEAIVFGCSATRDPDAWRGIEGVSEVIVDKEHLAGFLKNRGLLQVPDGIDGFGARHRAYVKVQDGCRVGCSYCIIPKVRPVLRSRPETTVVEEVRRLSENGYREIVLTGIHLGHYGLDRPERPTLAGLVRRIIELDVPFRLRISSLEAVEVSDELVDLMVRYPDRICPHLHLSMQSGSDEVLRRMRRRWLRDPFVRRCEEILARFDRLALTTDVIVGFPGETEEQFEESCRTVERLNFSKVHVFRFSPREGTEAAGLPERIAPPVQKRRAETLASISDRLRCGYATSFRGDMASVLIESPDRGTTDRYLDLRLTCPVDPDQVGRIVSVRVTDVRGEVLFADSGFRQK